MTLLSLEREVLSGALEMEADEDNDDDGGGEGRAMARGLADGRPARLVGEERALMRAAAPWRPGGGMGAAARLTPVRRSPPGGASEGDAPRPPRERAWEPPLRNLAARSSAAARPESAAAQRERLLASHAASLQQRRAAEAARIAAGNLDLLHRLRSASSASRPWSDGAAWPPSCPPRRAPYAKEAAQRELDAQNEFLAKRLLRLCGGRPASAAAPPAGEGRLGQIARTYSARATPRLQAATPPRRRPEWAII